MFIYAAFITLLCIITPHENYTKFNPLFGVRADRAYPVPDKLIKDMNENELSLVLEYAKNIDDTDLVFKCFFHLMAIAKQQVTLKKYKLDLADYCFTLQDYPKASICYEEFFILFPGSQEAEYSQYKSILCSFYLTLASDRDQTQSQKTISLIQLFLARAKNPKFIQETKDMYTTCRKKLFEHEIHVLEYYLSKQKFISAEQRLAYIEKNFSDIVNIDKYLTYCKNTLETVKNQATRPFMVKLNLSQALSNNSAEPIEQPSVLDKLTSFFLA